MSAKYTKTRFKVGEVEYLGKADLARMRRMTEEEIMRTSPPELADLPANWLKEAVLVPPIIKEPISIRVDEDVLAWFRSRGPRYQTRMNAVLRAYMKQVSGKKVRG
jgi:uncharacterized protein (DUF4415 family)